MTDFLCMRELTNLAQRSPFSLGELLQSLSVSWLIAENTCRKRKRKKNNLHKSVYLNMLPICPKNNILTKAIKSLYLPTSVYHSRLLMRLFVLVPMIQTVHLTLRCSFVVIEVQSIILNFLKSTIKLTAQAFISITNRYQFGITKTALMSQKALLLKSLLLPI